MKQWSCSLELGINGRERPYFPTSPPHTLHPQKTINSKLYPLQFQKFLLHYASLSVFQSSLPKTENIRVASMRGGGEHAFTELKHHSASTEPVSLNKHTSFHIYSDNIPCRSFKRHWLGTCHGQSM